MLNLFSLLILILLFSVNLKTRTDTTNYFKVLVSGRRVAQCLEMVGHELLSPCCGHRF